MTQDLCFMTIIMLITSPDRALVLCCRPPLLYRHMSRSLAGPQLPPLLWYTLLYRHMSASLAGPQLPPLLWYTLLYRHMSASLAGPQLPPLLWYTLLYKQLSPIIANVLLVWNILKLRDSTSEQPYNTEDHHDGNLNLLLWPDTQEMPL